MANTRGHRSNNDTFDELTAVDNFVGLERNILTVALIDSPSHNIQIPLSFLSPQLSPDEQIIQLRGRKKITWSQQYDYDLVHSPLKTPTKKFSSMQLRSSPRKRILSVCNDESTPEKKKMFSPTKRIKFDESSASKSNIGIPLAKLLKGMENNQLIEIILDLIKQEPHLEKHIRSNLPTPDLRSMQEKLNVLKRNILKSLPNKTRLVSKTDSASFSRASTHISSFKKCLMQQLKFLYDSAHWTFLVDHILSAWNYVKGLPLFDNTSHNVIRNYCFKQLVYYLDLGLKNGNVYLGEKRLNEISLKLKVMSIDYNDTVKLKRDVEAIIEQLQNK